jgi:hypothetical protein
LAALRPTRLRRHDPLEQLPRLIWDKTLHHRRDRPLLIASNETTSKCDPLRTLPTIDEHIRRVTFGDWGMATYVVIDSPPIVRVVDITWVG